MTRRAHCIVTLDARVAAMAVMAFALLQFLLFIAGWITGEHAWVAARDAFERPQLRPVTLSGIPAFIPASGHVVEEPLVLRFAALPPPPKPRPLSRKPYRQLIEEAASRHDLPVALVEAIVLVESDFDSRAISPKGARGLMQVMPATGKRFGVRDPDQLLDPVPNLAAGTAYLAWLLERFDGNLDLALAAYNAGEGAVDSYGGIPPYRETQEYVRRVRRALSRNTA